MLTFLKWYAFTRWRNRPYILPIDLRRSTVESIGKDRFVEILISAAIAMAADGGRDIRTWDIQIEWVDKRDVVTAIVRCTPC